MPDAPHPITPVATAAAASDGGPVADLADDEAGGSVQAGVQSVEIAATILKALAEQARPLPLKAIAQATRMSRAKVHRYPVSLKRAGLVSQESRSGDYRIGPAAVTLGLVGLRSMSPVRTIHDSLPALRDRLGETVTMAIWGDGGPTVIAMEETGRTVTINVRVGSMLPVMGSAIGRAFAAFMPAALTEATIARERNQARTEGAVPPDAAEFAAMLDDVRARGMARSRGLLLPGVDALAAPVFDHGGKLIAVVCALGRAGSFDSRWSGAPAAILAETVAGLSHQFGYVASAEG